MSETTEEPIEPGWYGYTGGNPNMIFHLRAPSGQWSAHFDNGTADDCGWSYIEQALSVYELARIELPPRRRQARIDDLAEHMRGVGIPDAAIAAKVAVEWLEGR